MSTDARGAREYAADDGFHEIQLSGKQLVFLFMATTVVSIVIFLCGVLVGRGGRGEAAALEAIGTPVALSDSGATAPVTPAAAPADVVTPSGDPGSDATTTLSEGDSSYYDVLNSEQGAKLAPLPADPPPAQGTDATPTETATPPPTPVPAATTATTSRAPAAATPPQATATTAAAATSSRRPAAWTIQVSAFRVRSQADQFVSQLKAKRYDAYVVDPDASSDLFRVRVGSYSERRDATRVADRLKKDKFKPWVTR